MVHNSRSQPQVHKDRRDYHNLRNMLPFLWEYRGRALFALGCLVVAKFANVGIPLVLKEIVDLLEKGDRTLLVLPLFLLLGYGALRLSSSLFNELRDAIFARVRYRAMRNLSSRVLSHLHELSLRFHLEPSAVTWNGVPVQSVPFLTTWCSASYRCWLSSVWLRRFY